jgi:hypothetical protein
MAKKAIVEMDILLIQGEPHFARVNGATFTISAVRKGNVLMTKRVLHKLEHIICNPNPATGAMRAFEVTALTNPLHNGHFITTPPTTVTVSQQKIGHLTTIHSKETNEVKLVEKYLYVLYITYSCQIHYFADDIFFKLRALFKRESVHCGKQTFQRNSQGLDSFLVLKLT